MELVSGGTWVEAMLKYLLNLKNQFLFVDYDTSNVLLPINGHKKQLLPCVAVNNGL